MTIRRSRPDERVDGCASDLMNVEPIIVVGANDAMRVAREEIFGPVVCATPFGDVDEVVGRANDSDYGLAAGLWTPDLRKAHALARELRAGTVRINAWGNTEAGSPSGGTERSGYGREMGEEALELYTEAKSVWVGYG